MTASGTLVPPLAPRMVAAVVAAGGACKIAGVEEMAARFHGWGWPPPFMQGVGVVELLASALLLLPATTRLGGLMVISLQTGALFTRCIHGDFAGAMLSSAGLAAALIVTWGAGSEGTWT